jgi:hypothetical protein
MRGVDFQTRGVRDVRGLGSMRVRESKIYKKFKYEIKRGAGGGGALGDKVSE